MNAHFATYTSATFVVQVIVLVVSCFFRRLKKISKILQFAFIVGILPPPAKFQPAGPSAEDIWDDCIAHGYQK